MLRNIKKQYFFSGQTGSYVIHGALEELWNLHNDIDWIKVEDNELPENFSFVLGAIKTDHDQWVEPVGYNNGLFYLPGRKLNGRVTHWKPMPAYPNMPTPKS